MTKPHAIESACQLRAANGGTYYVIAVKRITRTVLNGQNYTVIPSKMYRSKVHGTVSAVIATA